MRQGQKSLFQIIPSSINAIFFMYFYNPCIFNKEQMYGDGVTFVDDATIKATDDHLARAILCMNYVIDAEFDDLFSFKVTITKLNGLVAIRFFGVTADSTPNIDETIIGTDMEIFTVGGAHAAIWTGYDNVWGCVGELCSPTKEAVDCLYYPKKEKLKVNLPKIEVGIKIDMIKRTFDVYYNNEYLGTLLKDLPDEIIPAIGVYDDLYRNKDSTVSVTME